MMDGVIQQIALGRADFPDRPVIAAHIRGRHKLAFSIGGVRVNQCIALVHAVDRTGQRRVALGGAVAAVALDDGGVPLLQNVGKALFRDLVPFDGGFLAGRDNIFYRNVHFLQRVTGADQNIFEGRLAGAVRDGVLVHGQAGEGCSVQMKLNPLHHPVLGSLGHGQITALEYIVKGHSGRAASDHSHALHILWQIAVKALLGHGVDARDKTVHKDGAILGGSDSALHLLAVDGEADTGHHAVLRSLFKIKVAGGRLHIQIGVHGISVLHAGHNILQVGITIGDQFGAGADGGNVVSAGCDRHRAVEGIIGGKG